MDVREDRRGREEEWKKRREGKRNEEKGGLSRL